MDDTALVADLLAGNRRALARAITRIENRSPGFTTLLAALHPHTGTSHLIGVTGAPGTGKSTLVNAVALALRARGETVGIVAVDPTSPFSGGAVLGDRIRMRELTGDPGVFIRSMASRGSLGGLARATADVVQTLDAAGFDRIIIETVGAGQAEVEIANNAHTVLVVEAPGLGDDVQAIKAGILEIADILVVNKADRPGKDATVRALKNMLSLAHPLARTVSHHGRRETVAAVDAGTPFWLPPVVETVAPDRRGIADLLSAIDRQRDFLREHGHWHDRLRARTRRELESLLQAALYRRHATTLPPYAIDDAVAAIVNRETDIYTAVEELLP